LYVGRGANNSSSYEISLLRNITKGLGLGRILWKSTYAEENGYEIWYVECKKSIQSRFALMTIAKGITKYKLDLVGVQVR
jgi:hypothetical protein